MKMDTPINIDYQIYGNTEMMPDDLTKDAFVLDLGTKPVKLIVKDGSGYAVAMRFTSSHKVTGHDLHPLD